jgi:hypothetical protein
MKIMNIQLPTKYANFSDDDSSEPVYKETTLGSKV